MKEGVLYSIFISGWFCCVFYVSSVNKTLLWGIWRMIKMIIYTELGVEYFHKCFSKDIETNGNFIFNYFFHYYKCQLIAFYDLYESRLDSIINLYRVIKCNFGLTSGMAYVYMTPHVRPSKYKVFVFGKSYQTIWILL